MKDRPIIITIDKVLSERGLSINFLANLTGYSYSNLHRLITNKTTSINFTTLRDLKIALNCSYDDIFKLNPYYDPKLDKYSKQYQK